MESRHINEIIDKGHVEYFRNEVTAIIHKIWAAEFPVYATTYWEHTSMAVWENGRPSVIRIKIKESPEPPLYVIWDLLHEYGHITDGYAGDVRKLPPNEQLHREQSAWINAEKELATYPRLKDRISEFKAYEKTCINSYKVYLFRNYGYSVT